MISFIIDETHLKRLSPGARSELLRVLGDDLADLKAAYAGREWDPEGNESYPLNAEEAAHLIRGIPDTASNALRVFAENYDGKHGTVTLKQLLGATGHTKVENVNRQLTWILLRLRSVTGNPDAWLINWRARDWRWDEERQAYTRGKYFISGPAVEALREAFAAETPA